MRKLTLLFLFFVPSFLFGEQDTIQVTAAEKHYEFLKEEIQNYRTFIQEERKQHQQFLTWTVGIVGSLGLLLLGIFGWRTREDINATKDQLINEARLQVEAEIKTLVESKSYLKEAELKYNKLTELVTQKLDVESGKFLFVGSEEKIKSMQGEELLTFGKAINEPVLVSQIEDIDLEDYDVVVYRSNVDDQHEDEYLKSVLLPELTYLKNKKQIIPLVIYCKGRSEFLSGETEEAVNQYGLATIANYTTTLIDNTASAFRVAKLMEKEK